MKNPNRLTKLGKLHSGQSMVELAVSFLVLVLLLGGAVDLGRLLFAYIAIRDAAQEGATYYSLFPKDASGMEYRVRHSSTTPVQLTDTSLVEVPAPLKSCTDGYVTVYVNYNFKSIMPLMSSFFTGFQLKSEITNSILTADCS